MATTSPERRIGGSENLSSVRERYGKGDFLASVSGMFAGVGVLVFLSALLAAGAGGIDYQLNLINADGGLDESSVVGLIVAGVVVFVSFVAGGFVAGRMARFNGGANGLGAGLWLILLVAIFAALGAWFGAQYNAFAQFDLPNWFAQVDVDDLTVAAIVASAVLVGATLVGGYVGGRLGDAYNVKVDAAIVDLTRKEA